MRNPKQLVALVALILFFVGFIALIRRSDHKNMTELSQQLESFSMTENSQARHVGALEVDHSSCRYLFPNSSLERTLQKIICPDCIALAESLRTRFEIQNINNKCARRGSDTLTFIHKSETK